MINVHMMSEATQRSVPSTRTDGDAAESQSIALVVGINAATDSFSTHTGMPVKLALNIY